MNHPTYHRYKRTRFWAVLDHDGSLLAVVVYKKGTQAIATRLATQERDFLQNSGLVQDRYFLTEEGRKALAEAHSQEETQGKEEGR